MLADIPGRGGGGGSSLDIHEPHPFLSVKKHLLISPGQGASFLLPYTPETIPFLNPPTGLLTHLANNPTSSPIPPLQPVNMFPPSLTGHYDVYGNLWEWMEDHFNGLPGFKTTYLYDDFSTPFYDDRHNIISVSMFLSYDSDLSSSTMQPDMHSYS